MEQAAKDILPFLMTERFGHDPFRCPGHLFEFCGWEFKNTIPCKVYSVERCINCGKVKHSFKEYGAVGKNAFDLDDPRLKMGGLLGKDYIDYSVSREMKEAGW